ncbi:MAG: cytochrome c3 family protein [Desulfomonilaceae bacterium]|nr:cytochrome c3 family protein [Desulfomonilaceae bacterium]
MQRINSAILVTLSVMALVLLLGGMALIHSQTASPPQEAETAPPLPLMLAHTGDAPRLERPVVAFDHDGHTKALNQVKKKDCAVCHILEEKDPRLSSDKMLQVFAFPKTPYERRDKSAIMLAYHDVCVTCHKEKASEGVKSGPRIGMCGLCHVKTEHAPEVSWRWSPIFDYARHAKHVEANQKKCEICHHVYDKEQRKLIYKKDTENTCRACHGSQDTKDAISMKKAAHAQCISCHMKLAEEKKKTGPFVCKGCHGEHKEMKPDELIKLPRLVRGQKDYLDISLKDPKTATMKAVPFNHKDHEARGQFCNACHHNSLEKCSNCHTRAGDMKKGGGVTFERAFHNPDSNRSCVGCHETAKKQSQCAGCHSLMPTKTMPKSACLVCHRGPSDGKPVEYPPMSLVFDKEKVPDKVVMKHLEKEFKPVELPHVKIVTKLGVISNKSSLARAFHAGSEQSFCSACHHKGDLQATSKVPGCTACHSRPFDPKEPGKPGILAAYHRQCMGCHEAMNQKPLPLECIKCHPAKEERITAGLIPALSPAAE